MTQSLTESGIGQVAQGLIYLAKHVNKMDAANKANKSEYTTLIEQLSARLNAIDLSDVIDDTRSTGRDQTYSIDQINLKISQAKNDILGGDIPEALDTIRELIAEISENKDGIAAIFAGLATRVSVDSVQNFTLEQQALARDNISAVSKSEFESFVAKVGDLDTDFVAIINQVISEGTLPE